MVGQTLLVGGFDEGKRYIYIYIFKIVSLLCKDVFFLVDGKDGTDFLLTVYQLHNYCMYILSRTMFFVYTFLDDFSASQIDKQLSGRQDRNVTFKIICILPRICLVSMQGTLKSVEQLLTFWSKSSNSRQASASNSPIGP